MKYYAFAEPIEAKKQNGEVYIAHQTVVVSEQEAIDYWRNKHPTTNFGSDVDILDDFVVVNYAYQVAELQPIFND